MFHHDRIPLLLLLCGGTLCGGHGCSNDLPLTLGVNHTDEFLVCDMSLLPFLAVIKDVAIGGATSSILYNELLKEIMTVQGLNTYTACRLHKYGWPNSTSQTSRGVTSHSTSSVNGLML